MRPMREIFRSHGILNAEGKHINGTDKETNHRYGDAYESLYPDEASRAGVKLMMEVGVADGSSLCAWREIFPNATIVGMDIHHSDKAHGERIEFHIGDQRSKTDCDRAAQSQGFDLIVEDATHQLDATLMTFLFLWPYVRRGGMYVVEEFDNVGALRHNIGEMWPKAQILDTIGPFGGVEPLVIFRRMW